MTPQEGLRMQIEGYRRMTPQQRLQISFRLYELTRTLVRQGVKHQHPDWDHQRVEQEVLRRFRLAAGIPWPPGTDKNASR
jgi:Rv0078B-related antitoxin